MLPRKHAGWHPDEGGQPAHGRSVSEVHADADIMEERYRIARRIEAIQSDTESAVQSTRQVGDIIGKIHDFQNSIASSVEEQSATSGEIARNLAQAARGTQEVVRSMSSVAEAASQTSSGAEEGLSSARDLAAMADDLKSVVQRFKI